MEWYSMVWKKYAEFDGRSRRTEYWMFVLFNFLAIIVLAAIGGIGLAISRDYGAILFVPLGLYMLAVLIPSIAVAVRRFHDTGKSGWFLLLFVVLGMIPIVGFISGVVQIVIMCQDGDPGMNQYGPNPKFPEQGGLFAASGGYTSMGLGGQPQGIAGQSDFGVGRGEDRVGGGQN